MRYNVCHARTEALLLKYKMELVVYLVILTLFSAITMFALLESRNRVAEDYFQNMTDSAEGIAVILARTTVITDNDLKELKGMSFIDSQSHPLNKQPYHPKTTCNEH